MAFLKKNSRSLLCIIAGVLTFILLAFSYYSYTIYENPYTGEKITGKASGYDSLGIWGNGGFLGVMVSLFSLLALIGGIALIAVGVISLLRDALGVNTPEIPGMKYSTLSRLVLWCYCGLNALVFVLSFIYALVRRVGPGFGLFLMLLFNVAYFLCDFMFIPKYLGSNSGPVMEYKCTKCGKKVSANTKFCPDCGGEVAGSVKKEFEFVCSKCGKKVSSSVKFCPDCGGEIESREKQYVKYVCEKCGKEAKKSEKFCSECGGEIKTVTYSASESEQAVEAGAEKSE